MRRVATAGAACKRTLTLRSGSEMADSDDDYV